MCKHPYTEMLFAFYWMINLPDAPLLTFAHSLDQPLLTVLEALRKSRVLPRSTQHHFGQAWRASEDSRHSEICQQLLSSRDVDHLPMSIESGTDILSRQLLDSTDIRH